MKQSDNLKLFCITNKQLNYLEDLPLILAGVGKRKFKKNYLTCFKGKNIQKKEKYYSELTFHYWFWKNKLKNYKNKEWIGFCQKRRFWTKNSSKIKSLKDLKKNIITTPKRNWNKYESIICKPIRVDNPKKIKLIKRGWRNILIDPSIISERKKQNIKLHFDMHHGFGILDNAINIMSTRDRESFRKFVNKEIKFNPHLMVISNKKILNKWFKDLFNWLFKCEKIFGFSKLKGYDQGRLYAFLAERYLSFWFRKYTNYLEWHWSFFEKK
tara:strand:- start:232 stop:1038 length:807 start_codon:yes stop_codon:yes gene_type:complete